MPRMQDQNCPYALLNVSPDDDFATIRAAWVKRVKTFHPDVWYGSEGEATRRLMAVNDAYDHLARTHKRRSEERQKAQAEAAQATAKPGKTSPRQSARPGPKPAPQATMIIRRPRRSPVAGRFDAARRVFSAQADGQVQAFA